MGLAKEGVTAASTAAANIDENLILKEMNYFVSMYKKASGRKEM